MRFRSFKKFISVTLAVMMIVSTLICGGVITEAATYSVDEVITYQFMVNTGCKIQAFEGVVYFPADKLSVVPQTDDDGIECEAIIYGNSKGNYIAHATGGVMKFQASHSNNVYDFTADNTMIKVQFSVDNADFSPTEIYTELSNIYDKDHNANNGNNPYSYKNVIDDRVISVGTVDLDNDASEETTAPTESTEATTESTEPTVESTEATTESTEPTVESTEPTTESTAPTVETTEPTTESTEAALNYTVQFNYVTEDGQQTLTKTSSTTETDIQTIVKSVMPNIENKMYSYTLGLCIADGTTITANLNETKKLYTVTVDGEIVGTQYGYKDKATVKLPDGTEYTFYVTGDTEISSGDPKDDVALSLDALTISDTKVSMDLLATANIEKFARMGVAFATAEITVDDIKTAVKKVTTGTAVFDGIAVHNSTVDSPNESGSYQFVYAPYVSKDKADKTLYFYTFAVDTDDTVYISSFVSVDLANAYV